MIRRADEITAKTYPHLWDGKGTIASTRMLEGLPESAIKVIAVNRIPPGASIGRHRHEHEEDCYFCISGEGIVEDNGREYPFLPGTLQITRHGETQAIRNTGETDLVVFVFLVAVPRTTPASG